MALVKCEPFEGLDTLQREMNRLLESWFDGAPLHTRCLFPKSSTSARARRTSCPPPLPRGQAAAGIQSPQRSPLDSRLRGNDARS